MLARDLLSDIIQPLRPDQTGEAALQQMQRMDVMHLPVVTEDHQFLGLVGEEDILMHSAESPVETYAQDFIHKHAQPFEHLFDLMKHITEADITVLPVVKGQGEYVGAITRNELFEFYNKSFAWSEPGSIIVIELESTQYSLSDISHIIEAEGGMVLSSIISRPDESTLFLTLKVNQLDVSRIVATLRRYEYTVSASYVEGDVVDNFKERYDAFMRYLDV